MCRLPACTAGNICSPELLSTCSPLLASCLFSNPMQLLNKADLLAPEVLEELVAWYRANCKADTVLPICALSGSGLGPVRDWIVSKLPESPSLYPKVGGAGGWAGGGRRLAAKAAHHPLTKSGQESRLVPDLNPTPKHWQDIVSELPERFFVAEIIRKHAFLQYRQEVPYEVAGAAGRARGGG